MIGQVIRPPALFLRKTDIFSKKSFIDSFAFWYPPETVRCAGVVAALQTLCFPMFQHRSAGNVLFSNGFSTFLLEPELLHFALSLRCCDFQYILHMSIRLASNCVGFQMSFHSFTCYSSAFFKSVAPTNGFRNIFELTSNFVNSCNPSTLTNA